MDGRIVPNAPPEWVSLSEARDAIMHRYGDRAPEIIDRLRELLPEGFPHRVRGWHGGRRQWDFRAVPFPPGDHERRAPAWLVEDRQGQMQVQDWDLARVDWDAGTVMNFGGYRSAIELRWRHITEWVRTGSVGEPLEPMKVHETEVKAEAPLGLPSWDEIKARDGQDTSPCEAKPILAVAQVADGVGHLEGTAIGGAAAIKSKRSRRPHSGGRLVRPEVLNAIVRLGAKVTAEGPPEAGDGGQASLERWFIGVVEGAGGTISEARARVHVRRVLHEARLALGIVKDRLKG